MSRIKNKSQITMRQVAEKAGVSIATVSRTLSDPVKVAIATRKQVEDSVKALGYQPTQPKLQPQQNANTILVLISRDDLINNVELLYALEQEIKEKSYCTLLLCIESASALLLHHLSLSRQICGLLFLQPESLIYLEPQNSLMSLPKVIVNGFTSRHFSSSVCIDNLSAAFHAVSYLYQSGHHRIACISGPDNISCYRDRKLGYLQALKRWGIAIEHTYLLDAEATFQGGSQALSQLFSLPLPPTAIFCHSDFQAVGVLHQANKKEILVPKSLSVIGFGNMKMAQYCNPSLTSVGYSVTTLAKQAFSMLMAQMEQGINAAESYQLECELVVRESTILRQTH